MNHAGPWDHLITGVSRVILLHRVTLPYRASYRVNYPTLLGPTRAPLGSMSRPRYIPRAGAGRWALLQRECGKVVRNFN